MKSTAIIATVVMLAAGSAPAFAAGCLKGAVVGGIAGHYAHHHAVMGAIAGCAVGHHMAVKAERDKQRQLQMQQHGSQGHY